MSTSHLILSLANSFAFSPKCMGLCHQTNPDETGSRCLSSFLSLILPHGGSSSPYIYLVWCVECCMCMNVPPPHSKPNFSAGKCADNECGYSDGLCCIVILLLKKLSTKAKSELEIFVSHKIIALTMMMLLLFCCC